MRLSSLLLVFTYLLVSGCTKPQYLSKQELSSYVLDESNGLTKITEADGYTVRVTYRPTDLLVNQEAGDNANPDQVKALRQKYSGHYYFIISLSNNNKEILTPARLGSEQFSELLQTISFQMSDKVHVISAADTINVSDYIYNRTFGMATSTEMLFAFEKWTFQSDRFYVALEEFGLGIGRKALEFKMSDIESAPKIYNLE